MYGTPRITIRLVLLYVLACLAQDLLLGRLILRLLTCFHTSGRTDRLRERARRTRDSTPVHHGYLQPAVQRGAAATFVLYCGSSASRKIMPYRSTPDQSRQ